MTFLGKNFPAPFIAAAFRRENKKNLPKREDFFALQYCLAYVYFARIVKL